MKPDQALIDAIENHPAMEASAQAPPIMAHIPEEDVLARHGGVYFEDDEGNAAEVYLDDRNRVWVTGPYGERDFAAGDIDGIANAVRDQSLYESNSIMKLKLGTLRRVVREVAEKKKKQQLQEMDRQKLAMMFRQLGSDIKSLNINSSEEEKDSLRQQVLSFPDPGMAERLSTFLNKTVKRLEGAFSHVGHRSAMRDQQTPGHGMGIMPSHKRQRRAG
jgi:hypothetical protein